MDDLPVLAALRLPLADEAATAALGRALAAALLTQRTSIERQGFGLWLRGDLGAGKTALVRALLRALGVRGPVKSPTFTLLEPYVVSRLDFYHFDFYRFSDPAEFSAAGFRELLGPGAVHAIEWPQRAQAQLPPPDLVIELEIEGNARVAQCTATSTAGATCLTQLNARIEPPAAGG